jgi:hypothetical protein
VQYYFEVSKTTHVITADLAHFADLPAAREAGILLVTVPSLRPPRSAVRVIRSCVSCITSSVTRPDVCVSLSYEFSR